ncbi:MAG: prepilin-type N-terminal cleavage/methylation domain-containing protein [Dehalococcoidales bacterium]|nr:prepilin-type N-terminal cleavage/methylation domain-containing protein [Dehalococcoidales bacterium]
MRYKRIKMSLKSQGGFSLAEVLVAMALMSVVGVAFLSSLSTASRALMITEEKQAARNIAEMQMEDIKAQPWNITYAPMDEIAVHYPGYSANIATSFLPPSDDEAIPSRDTNIQRIEITVLHQSEPIYTVVSYKANRRE